MSIRLPLLDSTFLRIDTPDTPMHVATLQIFALPEDVGPDFVTDLVADFRAPRPLRKPFDQTLAGGLLSGVAPAWDTVEQLDMEYHVRHTALPAPGGERQLGDLISHLHSTRLDRTRPLWTCHVIEGLENGRFAVYTKMHHSVTDGVNGVRLVTEQLATTPDGPSQAPWQQPVAAPPRRRRGGAGQSLSPWRAVGELGRGLAGLVRLGGDGDPVRLPFEAPQSILNGRVTNARRVATQQLDMSRMQDIAKRHAASLNDVFLAVCGAALRRYLADQNALPERSLIAGVPVNLRGEGQEGGNAVGFLWSELGTDVADPRERLGVIQRSMAAAKDHLRGMAGPVRPVFTLLTMALPVAVLISGQATRVYRPPMNVTISNVPGPADARYLRGARMEACYPVSLAFQGLGLNITCISYDGQLNLSVVGSRDAVPHLQHIAVYIGEALNEFDTEEVGP
ncbi:WS/DGAT/MGAT family O-acyltransferase [Mycobacterium sp. PDNC021]|uniref:WS/DGAT/MGAT family O-acyltransferase n=1 Tax=Mycobacterium sp. PDNC021 TaxID=3391399 RepID=UPI003AABACC4